MDALRTKYSTQTLKLMKLPRFGMGSVFSWIFLLTSPTRSGITLSTWFGCNCVASVVNLGQAYTLYIQGWAKKRLLGCEKVLPGCAWPVLSKTGPFFPHKPVDPTQTRNFNSTKPCSQGDAWPCSRTGSTWGWSRRSSSTCTLSTRGRRSVWSTATARRSTRPSPWKIMFGVSFTWKQGVKYLLTGNHLTQKWSKGGLRGCVIQCPCWFFPKMWIHAT